MIVLSPAGVLEQVIEIDDDRTKFDFSEFTDGASTAEGN